MSVDDSDVRRTCVVVDVGMSTHYVVSYHRIVRSLTLFFHCSMDQREIFAFVHCNMDRRVIFALEKIELEKRTLVFLSSLEASFT